LGYAGPLGRVGLKVELEGTRDCVVSGGCGCGPDTCREDCGLNGDTDARDGTRGCADVLNGGFPFCGLGEAGMVRNCFAFWSGKDWNWTLVRTRLGVLFVAETSRGRGLLDVVGFAGDSIWVVRAVTSQILVQKHVEKTDRSWVAVRRPSVGWMTARNRPLG